MRVYHEIKKNEDGFTLIELSVVIIILGIIVSTFTAGFVVYLDQTRTNQTKARLDKIAEAVNIYLDINNKLPCPAPLTAAVDTADFAKEINNGNCNGAADGLGGTKRSGLSGNTVRYGAIPTRALNLPDEFGFDGWGNRYIYAVQENLATAGKYDGIGNIVIRDSGSHDITNQAHFVVFSVGEDAAGGYNRNGIEAANCKSATLDGENCDKDHIFISTILVSMSENSKHYDDVFYYQSQTKATGVIPSGAVMAFNLNSCPDGWSEYVSAQGRFVIGEGSLPAQTYNYNSRTWSSSARNYGLGDTGGYVNWMQGEDELAKHYHNFGVASIHIVSLPTSPQWHVGLQTENPPSFETNVKGQSVPMENIPPYVALLYCEKH